MAKTMSMTRSQNHDDASNRKRFETSDNGGWSDLTHDVLFLVMMQLGVVDFVGFSGVCKSWRCFAHSNRNRFMASRPPMLMRINNDKCCLKDFDGRRLKPLFSRAAGMCCTGLTCGYVVLFGEGPNTNVWLVNPITRHELHFPLRPIRIGYLEERVRAILVFSRSSSISGWVLVMANRLSNKIWFSIAGTGAWKYVSFAFPILDLHAFKGKIYTLHRDWLHGGWRLCEMTLNPDPKLTLLQIKDCLKPLVFAREFASAGDNLYVIYRTPKDLYGVLELDVGNMKWVLPGEEEEEYAFFLSVLKSGAAINGATLKFESPRLSFYEIFDCFTDTFRESRKARLFTTTDVWYFPHECMNVDYIDG